MQRQKKKQPSPVRNINSLIVELSEAVEGLSSDEPLPKDLVTKLKKASVSPAKARALMNASAALEQDLKKPSTTVTKQRKSSNQSSSTTSSRNNYELEVLFQDTSNRSSFSDGQKTPERVSVQKIESFDKEDWNRSPTNLRKLDLHINQEEDDAAFGQWKEADPLNAMERARRAALESKNERKREALRQRRWRVAESCRKKKEAKLQGEAKRRLEGLRVRQRDAMIMTEIIEKKQLNVQAHYERQQHFRKSVESKRRKQEREKKAIQDRKVNVLKEREASHQLELNWRKKQFHQDPDFLSLVQAIHSNEI